MSKRRKLLQLSQEELKALLDVASKELINQITHHSIDPDLVSLVTKAAIALASKDTPEDEQPPISPTTTP